MGDVPETSGPGPDPAGDAAAPPGAESLRQFPCARCGAQMTYRIGQTIIHCSYCGYETEIPKEDEARTNEALAERDLQEWLAKAEADDAKPVVQRELVCDGCGAHVVLDEHADADHCPYCGKAAVIAEIASRTLPVQAVLPFAVEREKAEGLWRKWLAGLWFAPNALKRMANREGVLDGVYMPFWTYDAVTESDYRGERGDYYYVTVARTVMVNGKNQLRNTQERRTRWTPAAGHVRVDFDDVLVPASRTLSPMLSEELAPWDLSQLTPYRAEFLAGFKAEKYQVGLRQGFSLAQMKMAPEIQAAVRRAIGGDEQRVSRCDTQYGNTTFKHILLPVWVSAYRFGGRVFQFCVNARTGEVSGRRPWSVPKIVAAVACGVALAAAIVYWLTL